MTQIKIFTHKMGYHFEQTLTDLVNEFLKQNDEKIEVKDIKIVSEKTSSSGYPTAVIMVVYNTIN